MLGYGKKWPEKLRELYKIYKLLRKKIIQIEVDIKRRNKNIPLLKEVLLDRIFMKVRVTNMVSF